MDPINDTPRTIHTVEREAYATYRDHRYRSYPVFGWDEQGHALISLKGRLVRANETSYTLSDVHRDTVPENVGGAVSEAIKALCEEERTYLRHAVSEVVDSAVTSKHYAHKKTQQG